MDSDFSEDGKYFAHLTQDGKLKIWNTSANTLEQEFTPDYHLTSPCTCLKFFEADKRFTNNPGENSRPRKKKKPNLKSPEIILGTTSGFLFCYSISESKLSYTINSNTSQQISCLTIRRNDSTVYTGSDTNIIEWSLQKKSVMSKWKVGNENVTAILVLADHKLLTASKSIKMWNLKNKQVCQTFTGHSSEILHFKHVPNTPYIITGSREDRLLNCWNISSETNEKNAIVSFIMDDTIKNIALNISSQGHITLAATVRNGSTHIYQHTLNGRCIKPVKPKTTVRVVSDTKDGNKAVLPIHIFGSTFRDENTICIGHGSSLLLMFENVLINLAEKLQCLVRKDPYAILASSTASVSKMKTPIIGEQVSYLTPTIAGATSRKRSLGQSKHEVPMEQRLENLKLNQLDMSAGTPKANNVAQLLLQGLHSKDKSILHTVLCKREEDVIKNTLLRLPLQVIPTLVQELADLLRGKTLSAQIAILWLRCLVQTHVSILLSNPDLIELLKPVLCSLENRLALQMPLNKFKGRLELLLRRTGGRRHSGSAVEDEEALLVYDDKDTSDSDSEEMDLDNELIGGDDKIELNGEISEDEDHSENESDSGKSEESGEENSEAGEEEQSGNENIGDSDDEMQKTEEDEKMSDSDDEMQTDNHKGEI